eukprot:1160601-Pelagomonas_calceolata.AAC.4
MQALGRNIGNNIFVQQQGKANRPSIRCHATAQKSRAANRRCAQTQLAIMLASSVYHTFMVFACPLTNPATQAAWRL